MKKNKQDLFLKKAKKVHRDMYDYSKAIYLSARKHMDVICHEHGIFKVSPDNHIGKKSGCPKCGVIKRAKTFSVRYTGRKHNNFKGSLEKRTNEFFIKAKKIHGDRYDYSLVLYKSNKDFIILVCSKHGEFKTMPIQHLHGAGCPDCAIEGRRIRWDDFIIKAQKIHGNKYQYKKLFYKNGVGKVMAICPKHGIFIQKIHHHLNNRGCSACRESYGERSVANCLDSNKILYEREKTFDECVGPSGWRLKFDFYLPEYNTCIEYDGEQHYGIQRRGVFKFDLEAIKIRDEVKNSFCKIKNINLLRIPYTKFKDIKDIIDLNIIQGCYCEKLA